MPTLVLDNLRLGALAIAKTQIGVREVGENRGALVRAYQLEAGIRPGDPWCAGFVNWCAKIASMLLRVNSPLDNIPLQGYVQSYVDFLPHEDWKKVLPGDLFAVWNGKLGRYGHIGFVASCNEHGGFKTVEGNSNDDGSREGYEVCQNDRVANSKIIFLRWTRVVDSIPGQQLVLPI